MKILRWLCGTIAASVILLTFAWACGALYYDGPARWLAAAQAVAILAGCSLVPGWRRKLATCGGWFILVSHGG